MAIFSNGDALLHCTTTNCLVLDRICRVIKYVAKHKQPYWQHRPTHTNAWHSYNCLLGNKHMYDCDVSEKNMSFATDSFFLGGGGNCALKVWFICGME